MNCSILCRDGLLLRRRRSDFERLLLWVELLKDFSVGRVPANWVLDALDCSLSVGHDDILGVRSRPCHSLEDDDDFFLLFDVTTDWLDDVDRKKDPRRKAPSFDSFVLFVDDLFIYSPLHVLNEVSWS